jgi:PAP2 superfamily
MNYLLPPYGLLNKLFLDRIVDQPIPTDWKPAMDLETLSKSEGWQQWQDKTASQISEILWPTYSGGQWNGAATENMWILTVTDFEILDELSPERNDIFSRPPISPQASVGIKVHREWYKAEDDGNEPLGSHYETYDVGAPRSFVTEVPKLMQTALDTKVASADLLFKQIFQRPRPYQVAKLMGRERFFYEHSVYATTPSLPSGHCLQGMLSGAAVYSDYNETDLFRNDDRLACLQQLTVDIGDRRVMAGLHYPSDNICSWILALQLSKFVFRDEDVKSFIWDSISNRSIVYDAIRAKIRTEPGGPYEPAWNYMRQLAT